MSGDKLLVLIVVAADVLALIAFAFAMGWLDKRDEDDQ